MANSLWKSFRRSSTGKKLLSLGILTIGLAIIGSTAWIVTFLIENDPTARLLGRAPAAETPPAIQPEVAPFTYSYELSDVSIPLATRDASRIAYAQFSLKLDLPSRDAQRTMEMNRARVLNAIYDVASGFYVEDFARPNGKDRLKIEIRKTLSGQFRAHGPRELALEKWVMN